MIPTLSSFQLSTQPERSCLHRYLFPCSNFNLTASTWHWQHPPYVQHLARTDHPPERMRPHWNFFLAHWHEELWPIIKAPEHTIQKEDALLNHVYQRHHPCHKEKTLYRKHPREKVTLGKWPKWGQEFWNPWLFGLQSTFSVLGCPLVGTFFFLQHAFWAKTF